MKVYAIPAAAPQAPGFNVADWQTAEAQHTKALGVWLKEQGYNGPHTGKVAKYPAADGYALYMLADGKGAYGNSFLLHLPYGDAYQYDGVQYFPKKEVVENIKRHEAIAALFSEAV